MPGTALGIFFTTVPRRLQFMSSCDSGTTFCNFAYVSSFDPHHKSGKYTHFTGRITIAPKSQLVSDEVITGLQVFLL